MAVIWTDIAIDGVIILAGIIAAALSLKPANEVSEALMELSQRLKTDRGSKECGAPEDEKTARRKAVANRSSYFREYR